MSTLFSAHSSPSFHVLLTPYLLFVILNKQTKNYFTKGTFFPCLDDRFLLFDTLRSTGFFTTFSVFFTLLDRFCVSPLSFIIFPSLLVKTQTKKPWPISSSSFSQRTTHEACDSFSPSTTRPPRPSSGAMASSSQAEPRLFSAFATTSSFSSL